MIHFSVTGRGDFPFVMLSISEAWPVDAHAAHRIALSCPTVAPEQTVWLKSRLEPNAKLWAKEKWPITRMTA
jgi:hypothetical protein